MPEPTFTERILEIVKRIPAGRVATYGFIAALAGNPRGSRAVVWALRAYSRKDDLPWHRVINGRGTISLPPGDGYELQRSLLEAEGVEFGAGDKVDLSRYGWAGSR